MRRNQAWHLYRNETEAIEFFSATTASFTHFTIGKVQEDEANSKCRQVDYLLMRLKQGLVELPEDMDIVTFMECDGKPPKKAQKLAPTRRQPATLGALNDRYLATHANGTIEANSLDTCRSHLNHFVRVLGKGFPLGELSLAKLQRYFDQRAKAEIGPVTIRKELATLRAAWNWGLPMGLTAGPFPNQGLRYPKADEKPPFMTMTEVEQQVAAGADEAKRWEAVYLQAGELKGLLATVKEQALHPWIYPLVCFAAHTGARRSEIIRAQISDVDFKANTVLIREKKRDQSQRTTRRVPLTGFLKKVLSKWLSKHPGGSALFCHIGPVYRSKKRGRTTGHRGPKTRLSSLGGSMAAVKTRVQPAQGPLTRNEVHDHFKRALAGTKWEHIRGLHTLRHSFISACASKGTDQRLVQEWAGHMNEATSRRYRHIYPSTQQAAINAVFE